MNTSAIFNVANIVPYAEEDLGVWGQILLRKGLLVHTKS